MARRKTHDGAIIACRHIGSVKIVRPRRRSRDRERGTVRPLGASVGAGLPANVLRK